jgi:CRISPR/Cas system-associated protein Cas10 (large subunit of type III CRISPR-Cas system)
MPPAISEAVATIAQWFGLTVAGFASAWAVRRKMSSDTLQVKKDDIERAWLEKLQAEREAALERERRDHEESRARERATWELHVQDARQVADLQIRNALMMERIERLEKETRILKRLLLEARPDLEPMIHSGFGDLLNEPAKGG